MAIDFGGVATTDNYSTTFVPKLNEAFKYFSAHGDASVVSFTGTPPTGAKRLSASGGWEQFNGASWVAFSYPGVFTTVSASGQASISGGSGSYGLNLIPSDVTQGGKLHLSTGQTANTAARNWAITNSYSAYGDLSFRISSALGGDPSTAGTTIAQFTSTGLAVTGTLSSSGGVVAGTGFTVANSGYGITWGTSALYANLNGTINSSTSFSVTGVLSATGNLSSTGQLSNSTGAVGQLTNFSDGVAQTLQVGTNAGAGAAGGIWLNTSNGGYHSWRNSGAEQMRLDAAGNLVIGGTASGSNRLQVYGTGTVITNAKNTSTSGSSNYCSIQASSDSLTVALTAWGTGGVRAGQTWVQNANAAPLVFGVNDIEVGRFDADGSLKAAKRALTTAASVAFSATPTFDASASNFIIFGALTANVTSVTIGNAQEGQFLTIRFTQDATGGRTVTTGNMGATNAPSISGTPTATANKASYLNLTYNATAARWEGAWMGTA